jgi:hypothetical protein
MSMIWSGGGIVVPGEGLQHGQVDDTGAAGLAATPVQAPRRAPRRKVIVALACANVLKAQGETPRPDTTHNCAPGSRLAVAVDLPVS